MSEQSPEDRVAALERGMAALTERVERLEHEVLPRELPSQQPPEREGEGGLNQLGGNWS